MEKVSIENAPGRVLGYDITEIVPEKKVKRCAFKRGHRITEDDIEKLRDLGKKTIYIMDEHSTEVHEDDAATVVAPLAASENISFDSKPVEGKINFYAARDGIFKVDVERLYQINSLGIPSMPTIHNNFPVEKGALVAAFRIIPLTCQQSVIDRIKKILESPLLQVKEYCLKKAGIIVTGSEVYEGRIQDGFTPRLSKKMEAFGVDVIEKTILPDMKEKISSAVKDFSSTCDIIFVTGGTSVDPDDVTAMAMTEAGVSWDVKGNPIQPGNNFTTGHLGNTTVCAVPAAALFYRATALDVFLPRLLAGEKISAEEMYRTGHGGLCHFCEQCTFPVCPFYVST